ncbi:MAG: Holliday junction resolvase RuvX [Gemmatimonadetes bacterium]|nr:Holliday junction resolvase RuvX [Gemmatimonadota bacterium]
MGRTLAIDFGERRIGLAISDPTGTIAQPLPALTRRRGKRPPVRAILDLVTAHEIERIVLGLPLSLEGEESDWSREVRAFGAMLANRAGVPAVYVDERMTSIAAERAVRALGLPRRERERKDRIDTAAAMLILQAWLDRPPLPDDPAGAP